MSRSYRKQPVWKDNKKAGTAKSWKKIANRKFRRTCKNWTSNHRNSYKYITGYTYLIHDYKMLSSEAEARQFYKQNYINYYNNTCYFKPWCLVHYDTEDAYINHYWKKSKRK